MDIRKKGRGKSKSSSNSDDEISLKEEEPNLNGDKNHSKDKEIIEKENTEGTKKNIEDKTLDSKGDELNGDSKDEAKELEVSENNDIKENQTSETDIVIDAPPKDAEKSDNASAKEANTLEHTHETSATMEIIDNPKEKVPKGRKRKISEIKPNDPSKIEKENAVGQELQILTNDESLDVDMYSGTNEPLGKGKRARIPNKRYSDILISPTLAKKPAAAAAATAAGLENGNVEKLDSGNDTDDTFIKDEYESSSKKAKLVTDLSDPKFLKPFHFGWKRELVLRSVYDESKDRIGDIYYWSPQGKKVRSRREVVENLKEKELNIDNFSFFAQAIGIDDPEKEIIREAIVIGKQPLVKQVITKFLKNSPASSPSSSSKRPKRASYRLTSPKLASPKVSSPKLATSKVSSPKLVAIPKVTSPRPGSPRVLPMKVGLNETADSPSKIKTRNSKIIKMNASMKMEKMEVEESPSKTPIARRGRKPRQSAIQKTPSPPAVATAKVVTKKRTIKLSSITNSEEKDREETKFMDNYLQNVSYIYNTLLYVFQYLKVQDLLRAGCVCTMWRDLASHPMLWRTVRMKNSQVYSFAGLAKSLKKHRTKHLDLRKMLLPNGGDEVWQEFSNAIAKVESLRRIELCRCPASVVENLALSNPQLEVINAVTIKCESMNLEPLKSLTEIKELRLKSTGGLTLTSNIDSLKEMKALKHLSLTSIRDLDGMNLSVIAELTNLESLDLGECTDFPKNFGGDILIKLKSLERLRLEKGQGNCHTFEILEAVKEMKQLDQLELVNFDIKAGFDKALGACQNIKKLLIIPTYISQSATTNHMVLGGVLRLQKTLSHFVWGVTLELLRVTELFVDQCEEPKEKKEKKQVGASGDCIPVLKPVPLLLEKSSEVAPALEPPQVEILALPSLQKLLMQNLPSTRVKILKIPFHATWRQSITDSVN